MTGIQTKPEREFRVGAVRVAIWSNPRTRKTGEMFMSHRIHLERTYRDDTGEFKNTDSLETNDIPKAILALKKAFEYLTMNKHAAEQEPATHAPKEPTRIP